MAEYNGYNIEYLGTFSMVHIKNKGQGPAPNALTGYFTTVDAARKAIDGYLNTKKKGVANGSAKDGSTG